MSDTDEQGHVVNEQVLEMVELELQRDADATTSDLFELAQRMAPELKELSVRQFHAYYPLRVTREKAKERGGSRKRRTRKKRSDAGTRRSSSAQSTQSKTREDSAATREAIRNELMTFAQDLSAATSDPAKLVRVLAGVDRYVDRVLKAID